MFGKTKIRDVLASSVVAAATLLGGLGCTASVTTTPVRTQALFSYPVVHVESAPVELYRSPRVHYHGRPAYLVGSRWYYPAEGGWVYFSEEPRELRHFREQRAHRRVEPRATRKRYSPPKRRYVEPPRETRRRRYYD